MSENQCEWERLTPEEKHEQLFLRQKNALDMFYGRNAISKAQYDKCLGDLIEKMGLIKNKSPDSQDQNIGACNIKKKRDLNGLASFVFIEVNHRSNDFIYPILLYFRQGRNGFGHFRSFDFVFCFEYIGKELIGGDA